MLQVQGTGFRGLMGLGIQGNHKHFLVKDEAEDTR